MKNLLALAAFAVLLVATVGYFRGWYHISSTATAPGQNRVTIDIDSQKVKQDVKTVGDEVKRVQENKGKKNQPKAASTSPTPPALPSSLEIPDAPPVIPPVPDAPPTPPVSIPIPPTGDGYYAPPTPPSPPSPPGIPVAPPGLPQN
jgi:hypothetical protein